MRVCFVSNIRLYLKTRVYKPVHTSCVSAFLVEYTYSHMREERMNVCYGNFTNFYHFLWNLSRFSTSICVYTQAYMHLYGHIHIYTCTHPYACSLYEWEHEYRFVKPGSPMYKALIQVIHVCIYAYIYIYIYIYIILKNHTRLANDTYVHTHIHTYTAYTHIHIHIIHTHQILSSKKWAASLLLGCEDIYHACAFVHPFWVF